MAFEQIEFIAPFRGSHWIFAVSSGTAVLVGVVTPTKRSAVIVAEPTSVCSGNPTSGTSRNLLVACRGIKPDTMELPGRLSISDAWCCSIQVHPTDGNMAVGSGEQKLKRLTEIQLVED